MDISLRDRLLIQYVWQAKQFHCEKSVKVNEKLRQYPTVLSEKERIGARE